MWGHLLCLFALRMSSPSLSLPVSVVVSLSPSVCLSVCVSTGLFVSVCLSYCLCWFLSLSLSPSVCLSVCVSTGFVLLSLSVSLSVFHLLSVCLCLSLSVSLCTCALVSDWLSIYCNCFPVIVRLPPSPLSYLRVYAIRIKDDLIKSWESKRHGVINDCYCPVSVWAMA